MADSTILCANIGTLCEIIDAWKASEICTTPCGPDTDTNTQYTLSIAEGQISLTPDDGGAAQTIDLCTSLISCGFASDDSNLDAVEANDGTLVITLTDGTGAVTTEAIILTEHPTIANAFNLTMAGKTAIIQDTTYTLAATGATAPTSITLTSSTGVESVVDLCPLVQACDPTVDIDQVTTDGNGSVTITLTDHEGNITTQTISVTQDPVNTNVYNLNIGGVTHQISQIRYVIEASTTSDTSVRLTPDDGSIATEVDLCPIIANCTIDAIDDITTNVVTMRERNTVGADRFVTAGDAPFAGWGSDYAAPSEEVDSITLHNLGRGTPADDSEKWAKIVISIYDGSLASAGYPGTPVATAEAVVDPEVGSYAELTFTDILDTSGNLIILQPGAFVSGTMGVAFAAINSAGDRAIAGRPIVASNSFHLGDGNSYYVTQTGVSYLSDVGNTVMGFQFTYPGRTYSLDPNEPTLAAVAAGAAEDTAEVEAKIDSVTTTSYDFAHASPLTGSLNLYPRGNPFTGFGSDFTVIPGETFTHVRHAGFTRSTPADDSEKWSEIRFEITDGDLKTGTIVAEAVASLDPEEASPTDVVARWEVNGVPVTLSDADFPSGTMGVGGTYYNSEGVRAYGGEGQQAPGNFAGNSYYKTGSGWQDLVSDAAQAFTVGVATPVTVLNEEVVNTYTVYPPYLYAVEGREVNHYFQNVHRLQPGALVWDVTSSYGQHQEERWTHIPGSAEAAAGWDVTLTPSPSLDPWSAISATTIPVRASASSRATGITRKVLSVGDSTMANGIMLNELATVFSGDVMGVITVGTIQTGSVYHEGVSGKTAEWFATNEDSPFVTASALDVSNYFNTNGLSLGASDWVMINLGINDIFGQTDDSGAVTKAAEIVTHYTSLINGFKGYQAGVRVAIGLTIPGASGQSAFGASYGSNQNGLRYKQNTLILNEKLLADFGGREAESIFIIPINTGLDTVWSFPRVTTTANSRSSEVITRWTNGVHPSDEGYHQIADQVFAFLKYHQ